MVTLATLRALLLPGWLARQSFPKAGLDAVEAAVAAAEAGHRGEIRVVVALAPDLMDVLRGRLVRARAEEAFARLGVWDTEGNSGVLIYLAWAEHQVEIVADRGIAARVPAAAWEAICRDLTAGCRAGRPASALVSAVEAVGALLRAHFPAAGPENPDELPNRPRLE
jgi:uncharacterized membrane protein